MSRTAARSTALSKSDQVYEHVLALHTRGEYGAGQHLVIGHLAEEVGVSPVPVREALSRLQADGIVEYTLQKGFRIRRLDPDDVVAALEAHAIIEAAAVGLAVGSIGPEEIAELRAYNADIEATISDFDLTGFTEASTRFHNRLIGCCPNRHIVDLLNRGTLHTSSLQAASAVMVPGRAKSVVAEHEELLSLIESGADADTVEALARSHRMRTAEAYRAALG